ncbi:hypothetical protein M1446_00280 [Candidatus Dependentiae bacterium]|nr:hypothetical protein [Candidatus Dependentiae bacterium]
MKFLNKIFLASGLVAITMQPVKALDLKELKDPACKIVGTSAFFGAVCCGFTSFIKAGNAAIYRFADKKSVSKLLNGEGKYSLPFKINFGEAVGFAALSYGLYKLSMNCLKTA